MIDFHTHIFPEKIVKRTLELLQSNNQVSASTDGTETGLRESSKKAGIDCSVILPVATKPGQFESINRFAMQYRGEDRLLSFGGIHPDTEHPREELTFLKNHGFKGIKLHPDYQQTFIDDIKYRRIIGIASELGLIVSIHAGFDPGYPDVTHCTPERIIRMVDDVRPEKLVIAHMGSFMMWDQVEKEMVGIPAWFDTGVVFDYISEEQFTRLVRKQGADRILFATDSPWSDQTASVQALEKTELTEEEKQMIFHTNAEQLLGMQIPDSRKKQRRI